MKFGCVLFGLEEDKVAPFGERGLKYIWDGIPTQTPMVAPFGERGLKWNQHEEQEHEEGRRSLRGAWIEILDAQKAALTDYGRSLRGAWIEIRPAIPQAVGRWSRSLRGAWIEIALLLFLPPTNFVAPFGERGLKFYNSIP